MNPSSWLASPIALLVLAGCGGAVTAPPMALREVVLYRNGVGYFAREGSVGSGPVRLRLRARELDDVLSTLAVVDRSRRAADAPAPTAVVPRPGSDGDDPEAERTLEIDVGGDAHRDLLLAWSTQTSAWRTSYRVVMPEGRGAGRALVQGWAIVDNTTAEDWRDVRLTLASDAPFTYSVDMRTPRTVARPDATSMFAAHAATSVVGPDVAWGRATADTDHDGIPDEIDMCPTDPELYNGQEDMDGCPDMGSVRIESGELQILERVLFADGSASLPDAARTMLDAVAASIAASPTIGRVEVQGHADHGEHDPYSLAAERAGAVRAALVERGVPDARLVVRVFGDARPMSPPGSASVSMNRRVDFSIAGAAEMTDAARARSVTSEDLQRTVGHASDARAASSGTRYVVSRPVSVPAGQSAMVAMINVELEGESVLLYRPDPRVEGTAVHPMHAARLRNDTGLDLVPGPIALYGEGSLVGQGALEELPVGQSVVVPYGVDASTRVESSASSATRPLLMVSLARGVLAVENVSSRVTRYEVDAGREAPARLVVRHERALGYEPVGLPPESERGEGTLLVPLPLERGQRSVLEVTEERVVPASVPLLEDLSTDVRPYLDGAELEPDERSRIDAVLADRRALRELGEQLRLLHDRLGEAGSRVATLRSTVGSLAEGGASLAPTRRRLARELEQAVSDSEALSADLATLRANEAAARERLRAAFEELAID